MSVQINTVLRHLRGVVFEHDQARLTDGQLLGRFIEQRDEAAVAALVRRHGAMVWGVCRRILHNHHDAEDAFQATFLILVRKAPSVRQRELVGNWLYGVAQQTAMKARATAGKRRTREMPITMTPEARPVTTDSDVHAVLDAELSRLPDRYRAAIVLCDLHGKTRKAAARQLGIPEGTVAGHLTRGRALLARRLARRGLAISGASLAAALTQTSASAGAPAALVLSTIKAMAIVAAGEAATELISIKVAALTEGVLKAMFLSKLKTTVGISLVAGLVVFGSMFAYRTQAADSSAPSSPTPKDRLTDTLILLDKQWWEAASKYDVDTLDKILAEDWTGGDWNKAKSLEHYRHSRYTEVKILTERRVVRLDEHAALMSYEVAWRGETKTKGQPIPSSGHDRVIHCWVQHDGGWFVKCTECIHLPALEPAQPIFPGPKESVLPMVPPAEPLRPQDPVIAPPNPGPEIVPIPTVPPPVEPGILSPPVDPSGPSRSGIVPLDPFPIPSRGLVPDPTGPGLPSELSVPFPTPWANGARASCAWDNNSPDKAFDGSRATMWSSGGYAPGWIERDLGKDTPLASIVLYPSQTPEGATTHEIWVSNEPIGEDRSKATLVHTFKGTTKNQQPLKFGFTKDVSARYVQIRTTESPSWVAWWELDITAKGEGK